MSKEGDFGDALLEAERGDVSAIPAYLRSRRISAEDQRVLAEWIEANYRRRRERRLNRIAEEVAGALYTIARSEWLAAHRRGNLPDSESERILSGVIDFTARE